MWLPKDQRKLLVFYYCGLGDQYEQRLDLDKAILFGAMKLLNCFRKEGSQTGTELEIMESDQYKKVKDAQSHLQQKGLLKIDYSLTGMQQGATGEPIYRMKCIFLTTEGCDLARKYNHWFTRLGLLWEEHKVNPVWVILGFLGGIIATLITTYIVHILKD